MTDGSAQRTKRCVSCAGEYLLEFFRPAGARRTHSTNAAKSYRDRCIGCETRVRREEKANRLLRRKAKGAMSRHAASLKNQEKIRRYDDLEEYYGWSLDRMIEDIKRVLNEGCPYCQQKLDATEKGLGVVTLDIRDPDKPPHYSTNVQWCCARCNSEKQKISSDVWGARLSMWDLWRRHQSRVEDDPEGYGLLDWRVRAEQARLFDDHSQ